ncbi:MAG: hypothetical protein NVS2B17_28230 [Candidatus Velthaea sp.]
MNDALAAQRAGLDPLAFAAIGAIVPDVDTQEIVPALPRDHPAWQRDVLSISRRARALMESVRPVVVRVLTFWDHRVRDITIGTRQFGIDASGSYRLR